MNQKPQAVNPQGQDTGSRKGAIPIVFGVILVILGSLDSLLAWRGSFDVSKFSVAIIATGVVIYCIGVVKGRVDRTQNND